MLRKMEDLVQPDKGLISRNIFVDEDIYKLEMENIFAKCWLYLGHETEVAKPGDFLSAYMGEDPVILWRNQTGQLEVFLNTCQHRGMRLCRLDSGNAKFITCPYHGWTYSCQGALVGVPDYHDGYFKELRKEDWGLIKVPRVETYKGLIFANFDKDAQSLEDYLGIMKWYIDLVADRTDDGLEAFRTVHKWKVKANWKFGAENFVDTYHVNYTHKSLFELGLVPVKAEKGVAIAIENNGHAMQLSLMHTEGGWAPLIDNIPPFAIPYRHFIHTNADQVENRLGRDRRELIQHTLTTNGTVFPNFSFLHIPQYLIFRVWHPRGPKEMEVWSWCMVEKSMPTELKELIAQTQVNDFGPGGILEEDDTELWSECERGVAGRQARGHHLNYQMGAGHTITNQEGVPDWMGPLPESIFKAMPGSHFGRTLSDLSAREFYSHWAKRISQNGGNGR